MFRKPRREDFPILAEHEAMEPFHKADVLYALEWSSIAPGTGGWDLLLDSEAETRLISVVPPGSETPRFLIFRSGADVNVLWISDAPCGDVMEVGRYPTLRAAVLGLCPLPKELVRQINEAMESLYPRSLRQRHRQA